MVRFVHLTQGVNVGFFVACSPIFFRETTCIAGLVALGFASLTTAHKQLYTGRKTAKF